MYHSMRCIVPPDLLIRIARDGDEQARAAALATLQLDMSFRLTRTEAARSLGGPTARPVTFARLGGQPQRTIYDQHNQETQTLGTVVRVEGQAAVGDVAVNDGVRRFGRDLPVLLGRLSA